MTHVPEFQRRFPPGMSTSASARMAVRLRFGDQRANPLPSAVRHPEIEVVANRRRVGISRRKIAAT